MENLKNEFIEWKKKKIPEKEKKDGKLPPSFYMTGSESNFVDFLFDLFQNDKKFKKMMLETGTKTSIFNEVYIFLKETQRGKEE